MGDLPLLLYLNQSLITSISSCTVAGLSISPSIDALYKLSTALNIFSASLLPAYLLLSICSIKEGGICSTSINFIRLMNGSEKTLSSLPVKNIIRLSKFALYSVPEMLIRPLCKNSKNIPSAECCVLSHSSSNKTTRLSLDSFIASSTSQSLALNPDVVVSSGTYFCTKSSHS